MGVDWQARAVEWMRMYEAEEAKVRMLREIQRELLDIICAQGTVLRKAVEDAFDKRERPVVPIPCGAAEAKTGDRDDGSPEAAPQA